MNVKDIDNIIAMGRSLGNTMRSETLYYTSLLIAVAILSVLLTLCVVCCKRAGFKLCSNKSFCRNRTAQRRRRQIYRKASLRSDYKGREINVIKRRGLYREGMGDNYELNIKGLKSKPISYSQDNGKGSTENKIEDEVSLISISESNCDIYAKYGYGSVEALEAKHGNINHKHHQKQVPKVCVSDDDTRIIKTSNPVISTSSGAFFVSQNSRHDIKLKSYCLDRNDPATPDEFIPPSMRYFPAQLCKAMPIVHSTDNPPTYGRWEEKQRYNYEIVPKSSMIHTKELQPQCVNNPADGCQCMKDNNFVSLFPELEEIQDEKGLCEDKSNLSRDCLDYQKKKTASASLEKLSNSRKCININKKANIYESSKKDCSIKGDVRQHFEIKTSLLCSNILENVNVKQKNPVITFLSDGHINESVKKKDVLDSRFPGKSNSSPLINKSFRDKSNSSPLINKSFRDKAYSSPLINKSFPGKSKTSSLIKKSRTGGLCNQVTILRVNKVNNTNDFDSRSRGLTFKSPPQPKLEVEELYSDKPHFKQVNHELNLSDKCDPHDKVIERAYTENETILNSNKELDTSTTTTIESKRLLPSPLIRSNTFYIHAKPSLLKSQQASRANENEKVRSEPPRLEQFGKTNKMKLIPSPKCISPQFTEKISPGRFRSKQKWTEDRARNTLHGTPSPVWGGQIQFSHRSETKLTPRKDANLSPKLQSNPDTQRIENIHTVDPLKQSVPTSSIQRRKSDITGNIEKDEVTTSPVVKKQESPARLSSKYFKSKFGNQKQADINVFDCKSPKRNCPTNADKRQSIKPIHKTYLLSSRRKNNNVASETEESFVPISKRSPPTQVCKKQKKVVNKASSKKNSKTSGVKNKKFPTQKGIGTSPDTEQSISNPSLKRTRYGERGESLSPVQILAVTSSTGKRFVKHNEHSFSISEDTSGLETWTSPSPEISSMTFDVVQPQSFSTTSSQFEAITYDSTEQPNFFYNTKEIVDVDEQRTLYSTITDFERYGCTESESSTVYQSTTIPLPISSYSSRIKKGLAKPGKISPSLDHFLNKMYIRFKQSSTNKHTRTIVFNDQNIIESDDEIQTETDFSGDTSTYDESITSFGSDVGYTQNNIDNFGGKIDVFVKHPSFRNVNRKGISANKARHCNLDSTCVDISKYERLALPKSNSLYQDCSQYENQSEKDSE